MTREERACAIVAAALNVQGDVAMSDDMATLAVWDSLGHMNLVLRIEREIGRQLSAEEIVSITSVTGVASMLG